MQSRVDETESAGETVYSDVFRDSSSCGAKCALNIAENEFILLLLRSVLRRYRDEFHIDGVRWITNDCDSYIGGSCVSGTGYDYKYELAIQSFWEDVRSEGFSIVRFCESAEECRSGTRSRLFLTMISLSTNRFAR